MKAGMLILSIISIAFSSAATARELNQSVPDAVEFMKQVATTYRALSSYQDQGQSVQTLKFDPSEKDPSTTVITFTTAFERPNKFKFSWARTENYGYEDGPHKSKDAIWGDGSKVWGAWSPDNIPVVEESFGMAVAGATGISQGTALHIFRLLTDKVSGFRFDQLRNLIIARSESFSGVDCYVIHGDQYGEVDYDLWIGKQDFLIRKGISTRPDGNTATFERKNIVVNQDIPDTEFSD